MDELVDPRHAALVVVDVQNDYCAKEGAFQKQGRYLINGDAIIGRLQWLIQEARRIGVRIIYIQNTTLPYRMSDSAARLRYLMKLYGLDSPNVIPEVALEGSWGHQIVEAIKPVDGDLIVKKNRASAFVSTNLDKLLRINNIETLLTAGVVTQGCVMSTAMDALFHEYFVVIVEDCVDSTSKDLHAAALTIMKRSLQFDFMTSSQIVGSWRKAYK